VHPQPHVDHLVFGGEDHKTGQHDDNGPDERYERLESILLEYVPQAQLKRRWSGQAIETPDGLPYIGPVNEHQFVATGYGGNGMTFGVLGGMMAADWVVGRDNPWQEILHAERKKIVGSLGKYIQENVDYPYYLIRDHLAPADSVALDEIGPDEARIVRLNGQRCAVYRTAGGELSVRSAICTHLGCVVRWNDTEKTWDCPCHGSRFSVDGTVLAGPAESELTAVEGLEVDRQ
jgi:Rieske Fe-S protein